ncbi:MULTISPECIES: 5'-3' exonuclease [unclassified Microbacterium]|uniref:5'-3' exonuclease n=1 Tax=unclassified Microbacterium TaxID=2609290 RepID=UPI000C2CACDC|nr:MULTISPECIES: 5'-3' exonuclease [unclassified Microbacterium]
MTQRLMLLDTASLYFRAFYGVPDTVKAPNGTPVNAVRGLLDMIAKLVTTYRPTHLVACWDDDWRPQWRVDLIPSYKAHRVAEIVPGGSDVEEVPDPLEAQIPLIREALGVLGIPIVGRAEHEADDIIGSLAAQASVPVDIVTGDRDLFQLVDDETDVRVVYTARGMSKLEIVTDAVVVAKYGVLPAQYVGFAVMRGDASDGLPGVPGVGDKTAATLLAAHGDLAGIVAAAEDGEGMSAGVRAKILAALPYLAVAPKVVEVVRDLDLDRDEGALLAAAVNAGALGPLMPETEAEARRLAEEWSLGTAMDRALAARTAVTNG